MTAIIDATAVDTRTIRRALIAPERVALIGASDNLGRVTARPMQFLNQHGFTGRVYPVNPARDSVMGQPAFASILDVGCAVDHAYIMLKTEQVVDAFAQCVEAQVRVVSVLADGFAESGIQGIKRQRQLADMASEAGILLIGPNSMGVVDTRSRFVCTTNAAFANSSLSEGRTAVISQSGSLIGTILSRGQARGLAYATLISVGNEAGAGVGEIGQLLVDDNDIDAYILFLETLRNIDAISDFAKRAARQNKPVVAYMTGLSDEGQALSASHTGAMIGRRTATSSFLKHAGVHRVENFESLLEAPQALRSNRKRGGKVQGVTVVSTTGGGGAMVIDQLSNRGVSILKPSRIVRGLLGDLDLPQGHGKLIDVTLAGARYEVMKTVLDTIIKDPESGIVVVAIGSSAQFNPEVAVRPIIDAVNESRDLDDVATVVAFPVPQADESLRLLASADIAAFRTVESCAESVYLMLAPESSSGDQSGFTPTAVAPGFQALLDRQSRDNLNEIEATELLVSLGIEAPAQIKAEAQQPLPENLPFDYPCVVKLLSPDVTHKTEVGAVRLGITNRLQLETAVSQMTSEFKRRQPATQLDGVLIQATETGVVELLIGAIRDPLVGAVITVGMGGRLAELFEDTATRPAPVSRSTALRMLQELKMYPLLQGYRGAVGADIDAAVAAIVKLSQLLQFDEIAEAEINPLLVKEESQGAVILDAVVRMQRSGPPVD